MSRSRIFTLVALIIALIVFLSISMINPILLEKSSARIMSSLPESKVLDVLNEENEKVGIIVVEDAAAPNTIIGKIYVYTPDGCDSSLSYIETTVTIACINGGAKNHLVHSELNGTYMYIKIESVDTMKNAKGG